MDGVVLHAKSFLDLYQASPATSLHVLKEAENLLEVLQDMLTSRLASSSAEPARRLPLDECGGVILHALTVISTMDDLSGAVGHFGSTVLGHCGLTPRQAALAPSPASTASAVELQLDQLLAGFEHVQDLLPDMLAVIHALNSTTTCQNLPDPGAALALQIYLILKHSSNIATQAIAEGAETSAAERRAEEAAEALSACCFSLLASGPIARLNALEQRVIDGHAAMAVPDGGPPPPLLAPWKGQYDDDHANNHQCYCLQAFSLQLSVMQHHCFNQLHPCACGASPVISALLLKVMVLTFQALGGQEHLLSSAFTSCLSTLASEMSSAESRGAPSAPPAASRNSRMADNPAADWGCSVAGERTLAVLAALPGLPSLAMGVLTHHGGNEDKHKANSIFCMLERMMLGMRHPSGLPAFLNTCAEFLRPESSCSLDVRLQAIDAMYTAVHVLSEGEEQEAALESGHQQKSGAAAAFASADAARGRQHGGFITGVWPTYAVEVVLFAVMHDPSIKIRRACMRLLSTTVLNSDSATAQRLCKTLVAKAFDKDAVTGERALKLLLQLSPELLATHCSSADMAWVLGSSLGQCAASQQVRANLLPSLKSSLDTLSHATDAQLRHSISNGTGNQTTLWPLVGKVAVQCCLQDGLCSSKFSHGLSTLCSSFIACQPENHQA